jgi:hypothetical protein
MRPSRRRALLISLITLLLTILLVDQALWKIDPQGVVRYFQDFAALSSHALPSPDGLRYAPGNYQFAMYKATIDLTGFRAVPTNRGGSCRIAFIGDSVTFGMGSDVSLVDVLAPYLEATVINAAIPGYNIENIVQMPNVVQADGYVYLVVQNDSEPPARWKLPSGYAPPAIMLYLDTLTSSGPVSVGDDYFREHAAPLLKRNDVLAFAFEGGLLTDAAQSIGAHVIPDYTGHVSRFDAHPSPEGAAQIAESMRGDVMRFVSQRCADKEA